MTAPVVRRRWQFFGRVQGVGFRYRAQYAAQSLGLTGWVCNLDDGSVLLEAQGPQNVVECLPDTIAATSRWIMIESMKCTSREVEPNETSFRVWSD